VRNKPEPWFIFTSIVGVILWLIYSWEIGTTIILVAAIFQLGNFLEDSRAAISEIEVRLQTLEEKLVSL